MFSYKKDISSIFISLELHEKRIIVQGWGNVAGATAFYLSKMGGKIVGIIDKISPNYSRFISILNTNFLLNAKFKKSNYPVPIFGPHLATLWHVSSMGLDSVLRFTFTFLET